MLPERLYSGRTETIQIKEIMITGREALCIAALAEALCFLWKCRKPAGSLSASMQKQ
jgi:hypothetical protein